MQTSPTRQPPSGGFITHLFVTNYLLNCDAGDCRFLLRLWGDLDVQDAVSQLGLDGGRIGILWQRVSLLVVLNFCLAFDGDSAILEIDGKVLALDARHRDLEQVVAVLQSAETLGDILAGGRLAILTAGYQRNHRPAEEILEDVVELMGEIVLVVLSHFCFLHVLR